MDERTKLLICLEQPRLQTASRVLSTIMGKRKLWALLQMTFKRLLILLAR